MAFRLSDDRCEEIKNIVVNTFETLNIQCIPISGFEIAAKLGTVIVPYSSKSKKAYQLMLKESPDGFSLKRNDVWYIFYNDYKDEGRINNTLTHECGHIVLDHTQESELAEAEARFFAKYAIAPPVLIHMLNLKSSVEVFNRLNISYEAAQYAFEYYRKWLTYGNKDYTNCELRLLRLFKKVV